MVPLCSSAACPAKLSTGGGTPVGLSHFLPLADNKEALTCSCPSAGMGSPGTGLAAFPGSSQLHLWLSENGANPCRFRVKPLVLCSTGAYVAVGNLSSLFFPSRILPKEAPGARQQKGCWASQGLPLAMPGSSGPCYWPWSHVPGKTMSLEQHSSVACRGFGWVPSPGAARGRRDACAPHCPRASAVQR